MCLKRMVCSFGMLMAAGLALSALAQTETFLPDSITLDVTHDGNGKGGTAVLTLWVNDASLADAAATQAASPVAVVVSEANPVTVVLTPSDDALEVAVGMNDPEYYVSLDTGASDVTYSSAGPTFGLSPGDRAQLVVTGGGDGQNNGGGETGTDNSDNECPSISNAITMDIYHDGNGRGGKAVVVLYLADRLLADAPATQAAIPVAVDLDGQTNTDTPVTVVLTPSQEAVEASADMKDPSYYVALIVDESDAAYTDGPAFDLALGDRAELVLTGGQSSSVAIAEKNGGDASLETSSTANAAEKSGQHHVHLGHATFLCLSVLSAFFVA